MTDSLASIHAPVLLDEVLEGLNLQPGKTYIDGTLGLGGHSLALLEALKEQGPLHSPVLLGFDQDAVALQLATKRFEQAHIPSNAYHLVNQNFAHLAQILKEQALSISGGLLVDLGVSSMQLDEAERGFSFRQDGPLDMRMNPTDGQRSAADWVNEEPEEVLADLFWRYGDERFSRWIAKQIVERRDTEPFTRTLALAKLVERVYTAKGQSADKIQQRRKKSGSVAKFQHPATRVFQALRIAVNDELGVLERLLDSLPDCLEPGARVALISFHSLEDRLIKHWFKQACEQRRFNPGFGELTPPPPASFKAITRQPITAQAEELENNPRSRSAKLRIYERL